MAIETLRNDAEMARFLTGPKELPDIYQHASDYPGCIILPEVDQLAYIRARLQPGFAYPVSSGILYEQLGNLVKPGERFVLPEHYLKNIAAGIRGSQFSGGEGMVIPGKSKKTGHPVAVKVFFPPTTSFEIERFLEASDIQASIVHPQIPHIFDRTFLPLGEDDYASALVMEYIPGETLDHIMKRHHELDPRAALAIVRHVARVLDHIHECGAVHMDIKPSNLKLHLIPGTDKPKPRVVLLDFGISRWIGSQTYNEPNATPMHTTGYTAPELLTSYITRDPNLIGPWTDQYQLAMLAQQLLINSSLSRSFSREISYRILPESTDAIVRQASNRDSTKRYPSCQTFASFLEEDVHTLIHRHGKRVG